MIAYVKAQAWPGAKIAFNLTFLRALTGTDITCAAWMPETMDAGGKQLAIRAACSALETPFAITALQAEK